MNLKPLLVRLPLAIRVLCLSLAVTDLSLVASVTGAPADPENRGLQLPLNLTGQVQWAKYFSSSDDFNWNGTVAVAFDVLRYKGLGLFFHGEIETILEDTQSFWDFQPQEMHFVLVPELRVRIATMNLSLLWDHHSRHDSDRFDGFTERWNTLMLQGEVVSQNLPFGAFQIALAGGKVISDTDTDYHWEGRVEAQGVLKRGPISQPYGLARLRAVKTAHSPSGRQGFVDVYGELGLRLRGLHGNVALFGSFHRRHDADHFDGRTESLAMSGVRFEF